MEKNPHVKTIDHKTFVELYKRDNIDVWVNKSKAGDFVLSKFANKYNKPAYLFWKWTGRLLVFPLPLIFWIVFGWIHAVGSLVLGLMIESANQRSAEQFVLQNMLEDENFWNWVMLHNGAIIKDKEGNKITSIKAEELARNYKISADFIEIEKLVKKKVAKQEELVRRYGKIIEMVFKEMLTKYPAMVFPQSLLPAPKEEIKSALLESIDSLEYTNYSQDEKNAISSQLKFALSFLDRFTDDNEANEENNKILNNRAYQQALQKRRR
jgi:hypothetical protein